ncbi:hypothetical protein I302_101142 [Kwoniella bestiolae CBS 10118]|uniref:Uncharacterized protein n=1 Tax=Kwoniella bestiolae CBS 10118 TaxID=1296100 RepID=A0A1B9G734_9TREE|nr:hypothetical protein I302_04516 [Kwoniella bestiolae CBS 10118]OCF26826.1 hypothetical protein I302_04516 [Kwoniella bestiolae CBS 10118]
MKLWPYLENLRTARAHVNAGTDHRSRAVPIPLNPDDWLIDLRPGAKYDDKPDVRMYLRLLGRASMPHLRHERDQIEAGRSYLAEEMKEERGVFVLPSDLASAPHNALNNPYYLSSSPTQLQWTQLDSRGWWYFASLTPVMMRARCFMDKQGGRPGEKFVMTRMTNVTNFKEKNPGLKFEYVKTNIRAPLLPGVTPPPPGTDRFTLLISQLYRTNIHPALRYHFLCVADIEEIEEHMDAMLDMYNFYDAPSIWSDGGRPGVIMRGWYPQALEPNEGWEAVDKNRIVFLDGWSEEQREARAKEIERVRKYNLDD